MAKADTQKPDGCGFLSCAWWMMSLTFKVSTLVAIVALLVTVHQMNTTLSSNSLQLAEAEQEVALAVQQKLAAHVAYKETQKQSSKMQTELANTRASLEKLQVEISAQRQLKDKLDTSEKQLKKSQTQVEALTQKLGELEASSTSEQQTHVQLQNLMSEKASLEGNVATLQRTVEQKTAELQSATAAQQKLSSELLVAGQQQTQLTEQLRQSNSKQDEAEKLKATLTAKEKEQESQIAELSENIKKLEAAAKAKN